MKLFARVLFAVSLVLPLHALELPAIFADHMVLQRDMPVPVWGKAEPGHVIHLLVYQTSNGSEVTDVLFEKKTIVDAAGDWRIELPPMEASRDAKGLLIRSFEDDGVKFFSGSDASELNEYLEETKASSEQLGLTNILVGDVWHCGGQSNMSWQVSRSDDAVAEIAAADHPEIRLFTSPLVPADTPQFSSGGQWRVASPQTIGDFSAVAYYFGRQIHASQGVPIGLVVTSWGGASAEAYTPLDTLRNDAVTRPEVQRYEAELARYRENSAAGIDPATLPRFHADPGLAEASAAFIAPGFDDAAWTAVELPTTIETTPLGDIDGSVWFRRTVELPAAFVDQALTLNLGAIDDFDHTFVNGQPVGSIGKDTPNFFKVKRTYAVPAELTRAGSITIAVRVFDHFGEGGFTSEAAALSLHPAAQPAAAIDLAGTWRAHADQPLSPNDLRSVHQVREPQQTPAALWNGMIHPVAPFAHRGVLWYQGESNAGRAAAYPTLLPMMIEAWRALWDQPETSPAAVSTRDTPFLIVQLANYRQPADEPPATNNWGDLRNAQAHVAAAVPNAYLATAIDIGDADDIHPTNKQDVGLRLARLAEHHVYGDESVVPVGPTMAAVSYDSTEPGVATVRWNYAAGLTTRDGKPPRGFAIRTEAQSRWVWAEAEIDPRKPTVRLTHPDGLDGPFEIRYAYGTNPADGPRGINLVNGENLPAMPFHAHRPVEVE